MLTIEKLNSLPKHEIFACGFTWDSGYDVKWVAVTGEIGDWAIYYHYADKSNEEVKRIGDKFFTESKIRSLVPCDDSAFKMYRF